jgi:hypothetical protein
MQKEIFGFVMHTMSMDTEVTAVAWEDDGVVAGDG